MSWGNPNDLQKDLFEFSENSPSDTEPAPLPISLAQWNAHNGFSREQSIFDTPQIESGVTLISSGRGRGRFSQLYRPGEPVQYCTSEDDDIRRRLQEFNSRSYSNLHMEAALRMKSVNSESQEFCDVNEAGKNKNIILERNSLQLNVSPSLSPLKELNDMSSSMPPPLSQMRQFAKQRPKQKHCSEDKQTLYSEALQRKKT